ncbi:DUF6702 family protein [Flavitalea sp.]|nr:DUF6702 family protein [Flavitalea sp.]
MVSNLYKRFSILFLIFSVLVVTGFTTLSSPVLSPVFSPLHPIFVSVTEMNHNPKDKTLEISCKIFTDDFETVLAKATGSKIDLFSPKDTALTGKQISNYIGKHLVITIDGKPVKLNLIGFERELDAVWSYFEVSQVVSTPRNISVMNDLLYDNFKEQINLMHVTVGGKRKSTKLDNPDSNAAFSF